MVYSFSSRAPFVFPLERAQLLVKLLVDSSFRYSSRGLTGWLLRAPVKCFKWKGLTGTDPLVEENRSLTFLGYIYVHARPRAEHSTGCSS